MATTVSELRDVFNQLDYHAIARHFDQDDDDIDHEIDPYVVCDGVSVETFNSYIGDGEELPFRLRFLELIDGRVVIMDLATTIHESAIRAFDFTFLTASGNGREVGMGGSTTVELPGGPKKEADASFGPLIDTPHRTPVPSGITCDKWFTLAVEIGRSQSWASLNRAAQIWCEYPGIQYILLMKITPQGAQMRYALYDIAVQGVLPAVPTRSGRFERRNTPHPPEIISFDMHRILNCTMERCTCGGSTTSTARWRSSRTSSTSMMRTGSSPDVDTTCVRRQNTILDLS